MKKQSFLVDNLKCGGCVSAIYLELSKIAACKAVAVNLETQEVEVVGSVESENVIKALNKLGYPLKNQGNLMHKAKAIYSCASNKF